jgi:hypothetical protein
MAESTQSSPPVTPPDGKVTTRRLVGLPDPTPAKGVVLETLREAGSEQNRGLSKDVLTSVFWLAHLYYAKRHRGYLTEWSLIRTPYGAEIKDRGAILQELIRDGLVATESSEVGPFPCTLYGCTGKRFVSDLPAGATEAIRDALRFLLAHQSPWPSFGGWWVAFSRAWRSTAVGAEIDIYLDLIPDEEYEEQRRQLEGLKAGLADIFA